MELYCDIRKVVLKISEETFTFFFQEHTCTLERTEGTSVFNILLVEKCAEELCSKCLHVLWMSKHEPTLVPQTNNLSQRTL